MESRRTFLGKLIAAFLGGPIAAKINPVKLKGTGHIFGNLQELPLPIVHRDFSLGWSTTLCKKDWVSLDLEAIEEAGKRVALNIEKYILENY